MAGKSGGAAGAGAIYGLGIFGAWVYFFANASNFGEGLLALFQGVFWPAWMVFAAFDALYA